MRTEEQFIQELIEQAPEGENESFVVASIARAEKRLRAEVASGMHPALVELFSRAGASDRDRPAWLGQRSGGVTATNLRDLLTGKITRQALAEEKADALAILNEGTTAAREEWLAAGDLNGIPWVRWGNEREPIIAAMLERTLGMRPETRVFHHRENPRMLASPDGVKVDFLGRLECSEIKTTGKPKPIGSEAFEQSGYLIQMVAQMLVLGAVRCRYVFELRHGDRNGPYEPGEVFGEWVVLADHAALALRILEETSAFLMVLDAELARRAAGDERSIDEPTDLAALNVLRYRAEEKLAKEAKEAEWQKLLGWLREGGEDFEQTSTLVKLTFKAEATVEEEQVVPDDEHPEVALAIAELESAKEALAAARAAHTKTITATVVTQKESLTVNPSKDARKPKEKAA